MTDFNLVSEPWIKTSRGRQSLQSLFAGSENLALQGTAIERFCLYRLLVAICQAACRLEEETDWDVLSDDEMRRAVLEYLSEKEDLFDLHHPEKPFLQYPQLKSDKALPIGAYTLGVSSGNTTVVFDGNRMPSLRDADKVYVLLQQCILPFSGKKIDAKLVLQPGFEKKKSAPIAPALGQRGLLHSIPLGETLWETLRLGLATEEALDEVAYVDEIGLPPWEAMPVEDDAVARRLKRSYMGRLLPMQRFCRIDGDLLHVTSGIEMPSVYSGQVDFSVTVATSQDKKQSFSVLPADVSTQPWRRLEAVLGFCVEKPRWNCLLVRLAAQREDLRKGLWCFGIQVSSNSGEQYLSGPDDVVDSEIRFSEDFQLTLFYGRYQVELNQLNVASKYIWTAAKGYFDALGAKEERSAELANKAKDLFWRKIGELSDDLMRACESNSNEDLHQKFRAAALSAFDETCPRCTSRQIIAWGRNRPSLGKIWPQD